MKKLVSILMMLLVTVSLFAGFEYQLDGVSFDPLHESYKADKRNPTTAMNFIGIYKGFPDHVYQDDAPKQYQPIEFKGEPFVMQFKLGTENISFLRNTFSFDVPFLSPISFDLFTFQGIMNIMMEGEVSDMMGYEGLYFIGSSMKMGDFLSMRFGLHHYCSHYGDAVSKRVPGEFNNGYKYIRMDAFAVGLSITPYKGIRLYGEYNWAPGFGDKNFRPKMFAPTYTQHNRKNVGIPDDYKDRVVNFGIELSYPIFKKLGNTTIAYDCTMYEEGKIIYKNPDGKGANQYLKMPTDPVPANKKGEYIHYDPDAPWYVEHGVTLQQELNKNIAFNLSWHMGRLPLASWYWMESQWASFGFSFHFDTTWTLVDTAR